MVSEYMTEIFTYLKEVEVSELSTIPFLSFISDFIEKNNA